MTVKLDSALIVEALFYASLGWRIIPIHSVVDGRCSCGDRDCGSPGKHPRTNAWQRTSSSAEAMVRKWFDQWPAANVAVQLGPRSGIIDVECDTPEAEAALAELLSDVAVTPTFQSTRGKHRIFRCPTDRMPAQAVVKLHGVEFRVGGGDLGAYSIFPPSLHASGSRYEWLVSPADCDPADLPESIVDQLFAAVERPAKGGDGEAASDADWGEIGKGVAEGGRNDAAAKWIGRLLADLRDCYDNAAVRRCWLSVCDWNRKNRPPLADGELRTVFNSILRAERSRRSDADVAVVFTDAVAAADEVPPIVIGPDESRVVDQAIESLSKVRGLYQRGGHLVHIVRNAKAPKCIDRAKDAPRIICMPQARLGELMGEAASWLRAAERGEPKKIYPPERIVKKVEARGQWSGVPPIEAVLEAPVLLPNGGVLTTPGFNADYGLFYAPSITFPDLIDEPNRDDAEWAVDVLLDVVSDFPFKSDDHRAAWVASLLSPLARHAYAGPTPLFAVDANAPGTGKGLLVDVVAKIATGRPMSRTSNPRNDDEARKFVTAIALAGEPLVLFDNISGRFGCAVIDAALTSTTWNERILGKTEVTGHLPLATIWFLTANNIVLAGDTTRRTLHIRLEFMGENPEDRTGFKHPDLLEWVSRERPRLVCAALSILRAYHLAGRPDMGLSPWGSFEGWSGLVRSAVVWAGLPDPAATRKELAAAADGEAATLRRLIDGWEELNPDGSGCTVAEAFESLEKFPNGYRKLRTALLEMPGAKAGKFPSRASVGMKLHHSRLRFVGEKCFDRIETPRGGAIWVVRKACEE